MNPSTDSNLENSNDVIMTASAMNIEVPTTQVDPFSVEVEHLTRRTSFKTTKYVTEPSSS